MKPRVIIADPPWQYRNKGVNGAAEKHYPTMSVDELCALPVAQAAADDCALFLWATWPFLTEALHVIRAWGFTYVTGFPWIKVQGGPVVNPWLGMPIRPSYGTGWWVRGCSEPILIARRGRPDQPTGSFVGLLSERFEHSRKPESIYHIAESMPGPYLEMFARRRREGWQQWGNQLPEDVK